ncbi:protein mono-ADP-ribosyltransferase TIPARP-like [Discoglossus pictus]
MVKGEVTGLKLTNEEIALQKLECGGTSRSEQMDHRLDREVEFPKCHIHQENDIEICSHFLVGKCHQNVLCPRHHTKLPYLWQLKEKNTYTWYTLGGCGQEHMERLFSDPKITQVTGVFQSHEFIIDFTTMLVHESAVFGCARRLSTSKSSLLPFHTCYNYFYEENNKTWIKYDLNFVQAIEEGQKENYENVFGSSLMFKYVLCLNNSYQENLETGTRRRMRARPVFRSATLMMSELWTFSNFKAIPVSSAILHQPVRGTELGHLYPENWLINNISLDYEKIILRLEDKEFPHVYRYFHETMPESQYAIQEISRIQNYFQWEKYTRKRNHMTKAIPTGKKLVERYLFHGTDFSSVVAICRQNFDPRVPTKNGTIYGQGCYFAKYANYSHPFSTRTIGDEHYMFLAKVLVGRPAKGSFSLRRPPLIDPDNPASALYDSCVSQLRNPDIFIIFDNDQLYPYYLITYCMVQNKVIVI